MASISHIMLIPFPAQGHMNPMMQFAKRLVSKGIRVTLVVPSDLEGSIFTNATNSNVHIEHMSFEFNENDKIEFTMESYMSLIKLKVRNNLTRLILKQAESGHPVTFLVYDSIYPSGVELSHEHGLKGAPFFTQSCAVGSIYYHAKQGLLKGLGTDDVPETVSLPSMPLLGGKDLPVSAVGRGQSFADVLTHFSNQFVDIDKADWIFFNTFDKLEYKVAKWLSTKWKISNIGPAIPSTYLDKRLPNDEDYSINIFKPDSEDCIKWLDSKNPGSVVYVSFGSVIKLNQEQMNAVALGLLQSNYYILWVVRDLEQSKLPTEFIAKVGDKGLIVSWCPQLQVLSHKSVGSFMTHCGWNSTLEALSLGVPMIAFPQWFDQTTNAKFIVDEWGVGVRIKVDDKGILASEEVAMRVKDVMEGEKGDELKSNAVKWKNLAIEAVKEGGSSDKNIDEFISQLLSC